MSTGDEDSARSSPRKLSPTRDNKNKSPSSPRKSTLGGPNYSGQYTKFSRYGIDDDDAKKREFDTYRSEARTRATAGKFDQSIDMYNKAVELQPKHTDCLIARATCHLQVCDFDNAVADADRAIQVNPKLAKANHI